MVMPSSPVWSGQQPQNKVRWLWPFAVDQRSMLHKCLCESNCVKVCITAYKHFIEIMLTTSCAIPAIIREKARSLELFTTRVS